MKSICIFTVLLCLLGFIPPTSQAQEKSPTSSFDQVEFNQLLGASKWDEAATLVDDALKAEPESPMLLTMSLMLANRTMRAQPEAAEKRFKGLIDHWSSLPSLTPPSASQLASATGMASMMLMQNGRGDEAIALARHTLESVTKAGESVRMVRRDVESNLARLLMNNQNSEEAMTVMRSTVEEVKNGLAAGKDGLRELVQVSNIFSNMFSESNEAEVKDLTQFVEDRVIAKVDSDTCKLSDLGALVTLRSSQVSQLTYSDPARGVEVATELKARLDAFPTPEDEKETKELEQYRKSIQSLLARLESSLARERLVGTVAPEFEAESFVGMDDTSLRALRGKVVLLDFWAVWCGPCIATFPHLRDWHEAYSEKGFVILGMTSDQGYTWDESKSQAVRGTDVSHEEELKMLASFRAHHKLSHGFVLTPKSSTYSKQLSVSGIPQAVLLDKQGVIRMIKVGSGPKNAHDLEEAIEKLLAEDSKPTTESGATGSSR